MAMHTRRDLLRNSLLLGGTLCTPRTWAAGLPSYTAGRYAVMVGGSVLAADSFQTLSSPPPQVASPSPAGSAGAVPPALTTAQTGALTAPNPAVKGINPAVVQGPAALLQAYVFGFSLPWMGVSQPMANWVAGAVNHAPTLQDGSFLAMDFNYRLVDRRDWTGGAITQVVWPGCDASSTAAGAPVITFRASTAHFTDYRGAGPVISWPQLQKYWRVCDFFVSSNVNINPSQIASVSPLTLAPAVYGGIVAFGYNFGLNAVAAAAVLAPFQAATQSGGMLLAGQSTDIAIQYGGSAGTRITLRDCRVASVSSGLPQSVVTMNYADASLSV